MNIKSMTLSELIERVGDAPMDVQNCFASIGGYSRIGYEGEVVIKIKSGHGNSFEAYMSGHMGQIIFNPVILWIPQYRLGEATGLP